MADRPPRRWTLSYNGALITEIPSRCTACILHTTLFHAISFSDRRAPRPLAGNRIHLDRAAAKRSSIGPSPGGILSRPRSEVGLQDSSHAAGCLRPHDSVLSNPTSSSKSVGSTVEGASLGELFQPHNGSRECDQQRWNVRERRAQRASHPPSKSGIFKFRGPQRQDAVPVQAPPRIDRRTQQ